MQQRPSSPSRTVAGGGAAGGGDGEDPFDGAIIPPEYLRWLLDDDDDDGLLCRATAAAEAAEASPRLRDAAPTSLHLPPMQRQAPSPSCTVAGGGDEEDPFDDDIVIPPDWLEGLDDDGGCVHGAAARTGVEAGHERRLSEPEAEVGDRAPMRHQPSPPPLPSCAVAGEGAGGDDDMAIPLDYLLELLDGDGSLDGEAAEAETETVLTLLSGACEQSAKPKLTNLVPPPVVVALAPRGRGFDRAAAVSRYREKRKSMVKSDAKAGHSVVRRETTTSRIAPRRGRFAPSDDKSPDELQSSSSCANCGESSQATPKMRRGPTGAKNFCNACGLAWANTRKIRKLANAESRARHGGGGGQ